MADPVVPSKSPFASKTFWLGVLATFSPVLTYFFPNAVPYLDPNGAVVLSVFGVISIILRFVTKGKIEFGA